MTGLESRYYVKKINDPDGKHDDCRYFVLDPQHDKTAWYALMIYAQHCGNDDLEKDIIDWLNRGTTDNP